MKDELDEEIMTKFVGPKMKAYSYLTAVNTKKQKTQKSVS